jgi:hypothetical protein
MKKLFAVWALLVIVVAGVIAAQAAKPQAASPKGFRIEKAASLGAGAGLYVTTISKGAYQSPSSVSFQSLSQSFTSSAVSILDQTVSSGTASSVMTAAGTGGMQMFYVYSSALDGTLSVYSNTAGTGTAASTVAVTAGQPYEWDSLTSGTTSIVLSSTNSVTFTPGTTSGGLSTSTTATNVLATALYP